MITNLTVAVSQSPVYLAVEGAEGGEGHTNAYLVGVAVFVALVLLLLVTLSFNRDR